MNTRNYYRGDFSLYHWCQLLECDVYQFDMLKRLLRQKGKAATDIEKTIDLIDIWYAEQGDVEEEIHYNKVTLDLFIDDWQLNNDEEYLVNLVINKDYARLKNVLQESISLPANQIADFSVEVAKLIRNNGITPLTLNSTIMEYMHTNTKYSLLKAYWLADAMLLTCNNPEYLATTQSLFNAIERRIELYEITDYTKMNAYNELKNELKNGSRIF